MLGNVNCLKGEVRALRTELASLKSEMQARLFRDAHSADTARNLQEKTCSLYVRLRGMSETCVGLVQLERYLHYAVLRYACVRPSPDPAFRVVIYKRDFETALLAGHSSSCFVALWRPPRVSSSPSGRKDAFQNGKLVLLMCWLM